jgi:putative ABC transport system substrate-binding protein
VKRREFISVLGGAIAMPLAATAQQSDMPTVGILESASRINNGLIQGLKEAGYLDGQNVHLEYRYAYGAYERLPAMADELVRLPVSVLVGAGTAAARAAKTASTKVSPAVPVVFSLGSDPAAEGLVASLNRPGGNVTGSTSIGAQLAPKRVELLASLAPNKIEIAILVNPENPLGQIEKKDTELACHAIGKQLRVFTAHDESTLLDAFAALKQQQVGGLIVAVDTFYYAQIHWLAALSAWYGVPTIGPLREFAVAGGLLSYGADISDVNRQAGIYVGRILKGAQPATLPVIQPTKFEIVINLKAAKALGLTVSPVLLASADEVIE